MDKLTDRTKDFPQWYQDVVQFAELAENGPVRGTMIIKPYGYALWQAMQRDLDARISASGASNMYFPLFIPKSFLEKEKEHVEGFSPELAVVTIGGGKQLEEPVVVRPTSETIINDAFSRWIHSYRDLPMMINQWANVVRWELRPRLFLRTTEFLWQEGHTAHATEAEADGKAREMLEVYAAFCRDVLALPVIAGRKSESEKFAGAATSYTIEGMMGDGKALQMGTSHNLGQNFAKVFKTQYLDESNRRQFVWQTSWGVSTRLVGSVIMGHGDDKGLVLPPAIAPVQVVIVPIKIDDAVEAAADELRQQLAQRGIRVKLDDRDGASPGFKFNEWELKGVPVRVEIGPKDLAKRECLVVRRDQRDASRTDACKKESIVLQHAADVIAGSLEDMQKALLRNRTAELKARTRSVTTPVELSAAVAEGFARAPFCGSPADEAKLKAESKATLRVIPFDQPKTTGACAVCGQPGAFEAIFARAY